MMMMLLLLFFFISRMGTVVTFFVPSSRERARAMVSRQRPCQELNEKRKSESENKGEEKSCIRRRGRPPNE